MLPIAQLLSLKLQFLSWCMCAVCIHKKKYRRLYRMKWCLYLFMIPTYRNKPGKERNLETEADGLVQQHLDWLACGSHLYERWKRSSAGGRWNSDEWAIRSFIHSSPYSRACDRGLNVDRKNGSTNTFYKWDANVFSIHSFVAVGTFVWTRLYRYQCADPVYVYN